MRTFWLFVVLLLVSGSARAQSISTWTAHTSMNEAIDVSQAGSFVWVATSGGVFSYDESNESIQNFTIVDGLAAVAASSVTVDPNRSLVWVGFSDGTLNSIHSDTGVIQTFRDIQRADQFSDRGVNEIVVLGDSLFIAMAFGVVVFDPSRNEVIDSYSRLGSLPPASEVRDIHIESSVAGTPTIWAATESGVARAPLHGVNLQDPSSWEIEDAGFSEASLSILSLESLEGVLYAGTDQDLFIRDATGRYDRSNLTSRRVPSLSADDSKVIGSAEFRLIVMEAGTSGRTVSISGLSFPNAVEVSQSGDVWIASALTGVGNGQIPDSGSEMTLSVSVQPSGPSEGEFTNISVGSNGELWVGGANVPNTGFHHLDIEGAWTTYSSSTSSELGGTARFLHVFAGTDGTGWAGSEGGGVAKVDEDGFVTLYNGTNSSLEPAAGTQDFIIVGGAFEDEDENMWFTTRGSGTPLHVRSKDGQWTAFGPMIGDGLLARSTAYGQIFVDSFDQKWILIRDENNFVRHRGLAVLETGTLTDQLDDNFRFFDDKGAAGVGLPGTEVYSVAEDKDGLVWIRTNSGPAFFVNTGIVARDPGAQPIWPQWADRSNGTFMLFGLHINDIAIDPAGRIWFATNEGAWLVESVEGGYASVLHFTVDNSPIFSDEILSIAVDGNTGRVYFSTDRGLVSFISDAVNPSASTDDLIVFPNPLRLSDGETPQVFIDGLVSSTTIRIVSPNGSLVRRLQGRGGMMRWDGKDENGRLVSSGVYLIIAVGDNDEGTAYGKVAVIR
ncbi:MAG: hypothetical protein HOC28_04090 [Bacteroidetes Order II. Incertae sedis bacterium]|nr:hypothetical protein [Bacteroidetes Order II. bacterium]